MADSESPKNLKPLKPGEEPGIEKRLLLAFALMGVVLLVSQFFYSPTAPQKNDIQQVKPASPKQAAKPVVDAQAKEAAPPVSAAQVAAPKEQFHTIDTDVFRVTFSNHGAVVRSWTLKLYRQGSGEPLELVNALAANKTHYPFSYLFENQKPATDLNQALYSMTVAPDGLGVDFEFADGTSSAKKSFRFGRNSYSVQLVSEVREGSSLIPHMLAWRGGFGDRTVHSAASMLKTLYFDTSANELVENDVGAAKNGPQLTSGTYSFAGIQDAYFAAVFLPPTPETLKVQTLSDSVQLTKDGGEEAIAGVGVGGDGRNQFSLFVGPKDVDLLRRVNPRLEGLVDFGWFSFLARPLFLALNWVNDNWVHNYGWAIIIVTILINFLLLPLKISGMRGMKKMSALQPQIATINERYKGLSLTDPKKQQQNQEIMELYKKHGVNPLGSGCMPLILQIPFFFAFYKVLSVTIEMRGADWLWIRDLAQYDPIYVLPVVMVATQFLLQKMTPVTTADPAQQRMMLFMPLVMGFLFFTAQAGLVLYWLTGNIVGIAQQWAINRFTPATAPVPVPAVPQKQSPVVRKKK